MPAINRDLHGNAPDKSRVALLLIDVIKTDIRPSSELPQLAELGR
jgi:hypothetical protein